MVTWNNAVLVTLLNRLSALNKRNCSKILDYLVAQEDRLWWNCTVYLVYVFQYR